MNVCIEIVVSPRAKDSSKSGSRYRRAVLESKSEGRGSTHSTSKSKSGYWNKSWSEHRSIVQGNVPKEELAMWANIWKRGRP